MKLKHSLVTILVLVISLWARAADNLSWPMPDEIWVTDENGVVKTAGYKCRAETDENIVIGRYVNQEEIKIVIDTKQLILINFANLQAVKLSIVSPTEAVSKLIPLRELMRGIIVGDYIVYCE